jgi:predicted CXXCH cytochrome family protein
MRGLRPSTACLLACLAAAALLGVRAAAGTPQNPYRLKDTNEARLCLACHGDFEQKLKMAFVHTAVRTGDCSACHNPHTSSHGRLLSSDASRLCAGCHDRVIPAGARSAHKVAADGQCTSCHDPHASANPASLVKAGSELCFTCHQDLGETVKKVRFRHRPVEQGCSTCHEAHGSARAEHLLKQEAPALCAACHKTDSPTFVARHMKYPVGKAACSSCHDAHGSDQPALLLANVHPPVSRTCNQCHEAPDSPTPFATKRSGFELCKGCHGEMVNAALAKNHLHWPVAGKEGCSTCHSPHASKHAGLLKAEPAALCRGCHADTLARMEALTVKHAPARDGSCAACHSPHGADGPYLLDRPSVIEVCATCHDYAEHSAHPIGEQAIDPRNKNLRVDCLSCHDGHGTNFKWMLLEATNVALCTRCHKQFTR